MHSYPIIRRILSIFKQDFISVNLRDPLPLQLTHQFRQLATRASRWEMETLHSGQFVICQDIKEPWSVVIDACTTRPQKTTRLAKHLSSKYHEASLGRAKEERRLAHWGKWSVWWLGKMTHRDRTMVAMDQQWIVFL